MASSSSTPSTPPPTSSSSWYHSTRIQEMLEKKERGEFSTDTEATIAASEATWSEVDPSVSQAQHSAELAESNRKHFEVLKRRKYVRNWGKLEVKHETKDDEKNEFFSGWDGLVVGQKLAEGMQGEIYEAKDKDGSSMVVKIFKAGSRLEDLEKQWPPGLCGWENYTIDDFWFDTSYVIYALWRCSIYPLWKWCFNPLGRWCPHTLWEWLNDPYVDFPMNDSSILRGATLLNDKRFFGRFAFVMDKQWTDLRTWIDQRMMESHNQGGAPFTTRQVQEFMESIAGDMWVLHKQGILHKDLKAANILVSGDPTCTKAHDDVMDNIISVSDFECSMGVLGSGLWRAPEILQQLKDRVPTAEVKFTKECDVYSFGMICYELVTGRIPFEDHCFSEAQELVLNRERPELPPDLNPIIKYIITSCWDHTPSKRPSFGKFSPQRRWKCDASGDKHTPVLPASDLGFVIECREEDEQGLAEVEVEAEADAEAEGEADDEDEYSLLFEGEMDPLRFAEEDENGKLPYEQFQRLEYEALAAKKRKNLAAKRAETAQTKAKQQDIFGASVDEIWDAAGFGATGGRRRRKGPKKKGRKKKAAGGLTPEINKKLGEANLLYATGQFDEAVEILKEVVRIAPNVADSYHTLGLLYDAKGDRTRALNFYMIAAHLTPKDIVLWKRLASWSMELDNPGQVIYCLQRAMRADPTDVDAKWDCASLYAELNDFQKAIDCLEQLLDVRPGDVEICKMIAKMRQKNGQPDLATQVLEKLIEEYPAEADLSAVNLLAELHMANGAFATTISWIDQARDLYSPDQPLPLDLSVKAGICHAYLGDLEAAESNFGGLRRERVDDCADLILEVGDAYLALGEHQCALRYYELLDGNSAFDNVRCVRLVLFPFAY